MSHVKADASRNVGIDLKEPSFYHRQYDNDIEKPEEPKTAFDQCKRVALVAFPFVSLCKPLVTPLALATDGLRVFSSAATLIAGCQQGDGAQMASGLFNTAISAASIAGTVFASPLGMLITTGHDIVLNGSSLIHALNENDYKKAGEMGAQLVGSTLYLGMFFAASLELSIAATTVQVLIGFYRSGDDLHKGNYLEASGHALMASIRCHQAGQQVQGLQIRKQISTFQKRITAATTHLKCNTPGIAQASTDHTKVDLPREYEPLGFAINAFVGSAIDPSQNKNSISPEALNALIKYGDNPQKWSPLNYAIDVEHDWKAAEALIDAGIGINSKDGHVGYTPIIRLLHLATHGHPPYRENGTFLLRKIIHKGIDVSMPMQSGLNQGQYVLGGTSLFYCTPHLNAELELFLNKYKINLNFHATGSHRRPIHGALDYAIWTDSYKTLIKHGAALNDNDCISAFAWSLTANAPKFKEGLLFLIQHGADPKRKSDLQADISSIDYLLKRVSKLPNEGNYAGFKKEIIPFLMNLGAQIK